ncbi:helix-turn-helix domain-containing protein [Desulfitobacterium sp. THU1]|uniref:helix-turn-helix domain-containing protein n=1 Tax=Desulfitobacterium sp. THU1 TaxID=3138072 RepID=UPI00311D6D62
MEGKELNSLLNPVRMRIFQLFLGHDTETVKRIAEELPDVPPASLYRHVNKLLEDEIIEVCAEYKIRGTVERVYRLKNNPRVGFQKYSLYLSDGECDELVQIIENILRGFENNKTDDERRLRKFSFVMMRENEK